MQSDTGGTHVLQIKLGQNNNFARRDEFGDGAVGEDHFRFKQFYNDYIILLYEMLALSQRRNCANFGTICTLKQSAQKFGDFCVNCTLAIQLRKWDVIGTILAYQSLRKYPTP
jgi:hypothetical protein